jgi:hypothetical protein
MTTPKEPSLAERLAAVLAEAPKHVEALQQSGTTPAPFTEPKAIPSQALTPQPDAPQPKLGIAERSMESPETPSLAEKLKLVERTDGAEWAKPGEKLQEAQKAAERLKEHDRDER